MFVFSFYSGILKNHLQLPKTFKILYWRFLVSLQSISTELILTLLDKGFMLTCCKYYTKTLLWIIFIFAKIGTLLAGLDLLDSRWSNVSSNGKLRVSFFRDLKIHILHYERWPSGKSSCLRSKRSWVHFLLFPNVFLFLGIPQKEKLIKWTFPRRLLTT